MARTAEASAVGAGGHRKAAACASRQEQGHDVAALSWAIGGAGLLVALIGVLVVFPRWREAVLARAERASRPEALADATLVYVEKLFRVCRPIRLVAKLDRAYRTPSGSIMLAEFRTWWINRPFLSDVIQLSAQRMALKWQTRQTVAPYGYVVVKAPTRPALHAAHRVELMSQVDVVALVNRREDILAKRVPPRYSRSRKMCRTCTFRSECDRSEPADVQLD